MDPARAFGWKSRGCLGLSSFETPTPFESSVTGLRVVAWGTVIGTAAFAAWLGWIAYQNRGAA